MFKLFSERNKKHTEEVDVYIYDKIPKEFRVQLFFILNDIIDKQNEVFWQSQTDIWVLIHKGFCKEVGLKEMDDEYGPTSKKIENFIDKASTQRLLDFIDYAFSHLEYYGIKAHEYNPYSGIKKIMNNAITDLNDRFQQHKLGYEFSNGELIRIDNKHIHHEYVKPALNLLHDNGFAGAEEEYMKAFEALRKRDNKNAIIEAEKAFESIMKTICSRKGYSFDPEKDSAKKLIEILKSNGFFPEYTENQLNAVVTALVSGAPTVRNRTSGHGQGEEVIDVPDSYAKYVIGLVAVNIVLLVQIYIGK